MNHEKITSVDQLRAYKLELKERIAAHDHLVKDTIEKLPGALVQKGMQEVGSHLKIARIGELAGMAFRSPLVRSTGKGLVAGFVADKALNMGLKFGSRWLGNLLKNKISK